MCQFPVDGLSGLVVGRASYKGRQYGGGASIGHRFNSDKHVAWVRGRLGGASTFET
ncbi:MAG: hypothetical protein V3U68_03940 [Bacteroidota bacterium]